MNSLRNKNRKPTHPGAILREDVLPELGITQGEFGWESYDGEGEPDLDEWQCAEPCESEPGDAQEIQADAVWESSR